jgi:hypothetical protein
LGRLLLREGGGEGCDGLGVGYRVIHHLTRLQDVVLRGIYRRTDVCNHSLAHCFQYFLPKPQNRRLCNGFPSPEIEAAAQVFVKFEVKVALVVVELPGFGELERAARFQDILPIYCVSWVF